MTDFEFWSLLVQAVSLLVTACIPATAVWGILRMEKRAGRRDRHWDEQHEENMMALRTLIERTASN